MKSRTYLKILFSIFGAIFLIFSIYIYYFSKFYPLPVTENIFFDAKLKFIRENIDTEKIDTVIIGSSVGVNNLQGLYLERTSKKVDHVLNLSIHGAYTMRAKQLLQLTDAFPNLKRVVYAVQYTDLGITHQYKNYNPKFLIRYMRDELSPWEDVKLLFQSCNNLFFCIERQRSWDRYSRRRNTFISLKFDSSGSVPLNIYGDDINKGRWSVPQPGYMPEVSYIAITQMENKLYQKGIKFYLIQQDYRKEIYDKDERVRNSMASFEKRIRKIMEVHEGKYLNLFHLLHLSDQYFADRNHFNDQGAMMAAKAVAKFIDENE